MTRKFSEMLRFFGASALGYDMHQKYTIIGLNYVRGIAAILIMLYHYTTRFYDICYKAGAEENHIGLWWGCWAVSVFFILSGFLTVYTLNNKTSIYTYIYKRAIRLYPAYWCAICLTTIVTRLYNVNMAVDNFSTIINFTMLQGFWALNQLTELIGH